MPAARPDASGTLRRLLLALLVFGLLGLGTELLLLGHYEDSWQMVPLFFIFLAVLAIVAHVTSGTPGSLQVFRLVMASLIVVGLIGVVLHYRGNLEFQVDMDPTATGWELFKKVVRAKAPPALAPGALAQLGLLGLIYAYRHPAFREDES
jgi:hypothetical protein